jgi:hypothetical protein
MSESGTPYHNIPEPLPISVDPSTDERARAFLREVTLGRIDRTLLDERLSAILPETGFAAAAEHAAALGTAEEMFAFEQRTTAEGVATFYRVRYPSEIWTWVFSLNHAGRINGFSLRRSGRYKIYDVWLRNVTY